MNGVNFACGFLWENSMHLAYVCSNTVVVEVHVPGVNSCPKGKIFPVLLIVSDNVVRESIFFADFH